MIIVCIYGIINTIIIRSLLTFFKIYDKIHFEFENDYQFQFWGIIDMAYKTKQKNFVLDCLKKHENESLSAEKIMEYLKKENISVGMATISRHLNNLCENGFIRKFASSDNESATYRYFDETKGCNSHFHLVCNSCGKLFHLECENLTSVYSHILSKHDFKVDTMKTVFYGVCKSCETKEV